MKDYFNTNILILRRKKSISQATLASQIGVLATTISNYESNKSHPDYDTLIKISKYFDVSLDDLIYQDMNKESLSVSEPPEHYIKPIQTRKKGAMRLYEAQDVPLYDVEANAGLKELFKHEKKAVVLDTVRIPNLPRCDGGIYVTGDSMYPLLKSGDMVLYKEIAVSDIFFGEMYLLSITQSTGDEYVTVKYIQRSALEGHIQLVSHNSNHQPKDIPVTAITALAMVKASIRINSTI